jgi:hypothetical protein
MPTIYLLEWTGVTRAQFREISAEFNLGEKIAQGRAEHIPGPQGSRVILLESWESPQAFELYLRSHLGRVLVKIGLPQPAVKSWLAPGPGGNPGSPHSPSTKDQVSPQASPNDPVWALLRSLPAGFSTN